MDYYYIGISKFLFIVWLVIGIICTLFSSGALFFVLIISLYYYFVLNTCKYYYNEEKIIVETGIFNKRQYIIPLYRIVNIKAQDNIFNFGTIYVQDKNQTILLKYVNHSKLEMLSLIEKWEKAKKQNIRNEVI